ncbi:Ff.00g040040.m01.CDS01 [Fusarium sp. VM40]|nr:Ff.00g040040.m01.CDS01 [Fusarium sp. VM40]
MVLIQSLAVLSLVVRASAVPYNTFDGVGFPACNNVSAVHDATSIKDIQNVVQNAIQSGRRVRASGKAHMWYDTMCSDDPDTIIVRTEQVNRIYDLDLEAGSVMIEAGVTFLQLADYLHQRGASAGYTLVNWNITLAGCVAMGAHRSSIREDSMVTAGVLAMDIIDGNGELRHLERDDSDEWLAASTSLGLLGVIVRMKFKIYPDFKVYADQKTLDEAKVLNGDIYGMIAPYATANFWWWPHKKKFHWRYYDVISTNSSDQEAFQNTFSITKIEAEAIKAIWNTGKGVSLSNLLAEEILFGQWDKPNFREKTTNEPLEKWPVYGWNYDVLIGGLYSDQRPVWEYGIHGYTLELAFPITQANAMLKRVRQLFDDEAKKLKFMASTYRSGINIKFGKPYFDLLGQVTFGTSDGANWDKGAIMLDFPSYKPSIGDGLRYNEPFYHRLAETLIDEFPCRPHWTKNTREVFERSAKNLDPDHISRFKAVREKFDPDGVFRSVVAQIPSSFHVQIPPAKTATVVRIPIRTQHASHPLLATAALKKGFAARLQYTALRAAKRRLAPARQMMGSLSVPQDHAVRVRRVMLHVKGASSETAALQKGTVARMGRIAVMGKCQSMFGTCSSDDESSTSTTATRSTTAATRSTTAATRSTTIATDETSTSAEASSTDLDVSTADGTPTSIPASSTSESESDSDSSDSTSSSTASLSTGAKAGIAVGAVIGGIGAIGLVAWLIMRKKNRKPSMTVADEAKVKPNEEARPMYEMYAETPAELPGETHAELPAGHEGTKR